jgi:hypothetical protein
LVLCGKVITLKKVKKLEKGVFGRAQIERGFAQIFFLPDPDIPTSVCVTRGACSDIFPARAKYSGLAQI